jgi:hypothetical protein
MASDLQLLVDADVLVYESAFAAQKNYYHYDGRRFDSHKEFKAYADLIEVDYKAEQAAGKVEKELQVLPENVALAIAAQKLDMVKAEIHPNKTYLAMSGKDNFRFDIAVTQGYKANRADVEKPVHFDVVKAWYETRSHVTDGQEADDLLGIWMTRGDSGTPVLATIDKDLNQIPGLHFDWGKNIKYNVDVWSAHLYFMAQVLAGDSTDNVPGIKGIGMKTALAGLRSFSLLQDMWDMVRAHYSEYPPEYLAEQGALVWVRRVEGEIWTPTYYQENYIDNLKEVIPPRR